MRMRMKKRRVKVIEESRMCEDCARSMYLVSKETEL